MPETKTYGLMAVFETPEQVHAAARAAREAGYRHMEAYTPFPVEGLAEAIGFRTNRVAMIVLMGGLTGAVLGYTMLWYANVIDYPLNVGGRPFHSWPAFIPITFELTVLFASFAALIGMLALNRLPKPYHPVFNVKTFERASQDRFVLVIESRDDHFHPHETARFLRGLDAERVEEVFP